MQTTQDLQQWGLLRVKEQGSGLIIGVDEVGYGCCAGPVTVCAAVASADWDDSRVIDSKKLVREQHLRLVRDVLVPPDVVFHSIRNASNQRIDQVGLSQAQQELVVATIADCRALYPDALVVMDGNVLPVGLKNAVCMPKADSLVKVVSAASILAKCDRDELMILAHEEYPGYSFNTNMGYGTEAHLAALERIGPCPLHRFSYRNIREVAAKFGMNQPASSKPSQSSGPPAKILGWRPLPKGMRVSTSSRKP